LVLLAIVAASFRLTAEAGRKSKEVFLTVTVSDKSGRCSGKLNKDDFAVYDSNMVREITSFDANPPAAIGIAIDISNSVVSRRKSQMAAITAIPQRFESGGQSNQYFVYTFGGITQLFNDWTKDAGALTDKLNGIDFNAVRHGSAVYDVCLMAIDKLMRGAPARRVLILVSDGRDSASRRKYDQMEKLLKESDVVFYSLGLIEMPSSSLGGNSRKVLVDLPLMSGGGSFFPATTVEVERAIESLVSGIGCQYRIGFKPSTGDGQWHSVRVKVASAEGQNDLIVRCREGYFARSDTE
jgi:VWFA-related protein